MKMRIWIINCPNSARTLKYTTLMVGMLSLFCLIQLLKQSTEGGNSTFRRPKGVASLDVNQIHSICVGFLGRLGNQLFQFASAYGIAKQKGMKLRISIHDPVAKFFNLSSEIRIVRNKEHCGHAVRRYERYSSAYDSELLEFSSRTDVLLLEYLQSWRYFVNVSEEIQSELTFKDTLLEQAQSIFLNKTRSNKFFWKKSSYVGLHVRRGDMAVVKQNNTNWPYNVATRRYIIHAMSYFLRNYQHVTFVVCSDDLKWVKRKVGKYSTLLNMIFIEKNSPEIDLTILSLCNHTIMTTGTFSWWAAWLAGGEAVYYKNYISETSPLRNQFNKDFSDYFLPHWIPME